MHGQGHPSLSDPSPWNRSPIIISGLPRSGTTWMQHYLSSHSCVHIHGQPPKQFPWSVSFGWYEQLVDLGQWAIEANQRLDYSVPHYAGADIDECDDIFRRMYWQFMTGLGPKKPRWGIKYLGVCWDKEAVGQIESFWPDTRWIVALRHPQKAIDSLMNTFQPEADVALWLTYWVDTCRFVEIHDPNRVALFDIDQLDQMSPQNREECLSKIWQTLGETETEETRRFATDWPRVHTVRSIDEREIRCTDAMFLEASLKVSDSQKYLEQFLGAAYSGANTQLEFSRDDTRTGR